MKKTNIVLAPLFAIVVLLLSVGALGELFNSLFARVKSIFSQKAIASEKSLEATTQRK